MKKFINILSLITVAALATVSCVKEKAEHEPGPADLDGCFGVYFPTQEASGSHSQAPDDPTSVTFKAARTNTSGAITVPIVATASEENIFVIPAVSFADGQAETEFTVTFDNAQVGVQYDLSLTIEDPKYASYYKESAISMDYSILREKWNALGKGLWRDDCFTALYGVSNLEWEVEIEENDITKGLYRVVYPYDGKYGYNDPGDWDDSKTYYFVIHAENPNKVYFDVQDIGVRWSYGVIRIGSLAGYYLAKDDAKSAEDYYGTLSNGVITFPEKSLLFGMDGYNDGALYYGNGSSMFRVCLPGAILTDFTMKGIEADFTRRGVLPLTLYAGVDVTKVDFVVAAGELTATQAGNQASAIEAGTAENVTSLTEFSEPLKYDGADAKAAEAEVTLPSTGVYTVVAVSYDDEDKVADYTYQLVKYVAVGDEEENAVDLTCGIGSAAKYVAQGVNTDTALEVWAYGTDIVDMKMAAVKYLDLVADYSGALEAVKEGNSVSDEVLAKVNDGGYVTVADKLLPGTEYYTVVWASNGYEEGYFISEESCTTTGDPLPIYQTFTPSDYFEEGVLASAADWIGTWNLYGIDAYGATGMREYLGKSVISASETPTEGPDDDGLYDEYVMVKGLFGDLSWLTNYGVPVPDDSYEMDVYGGLMYTCTNKIADEDEEFTVYLYSKGKGTYGWDYASSYWTAFVPVMDGYYAFMNVYSGVASYDFCGLGLYHETNGWYAKVSEQLLVDPDKDNNGLAPSQINAAVRSAKERFNYAVQTTFRTGNGKEDIHRIIDRYNELGRTIRVNTDFRPVEGTCPVKTVAVQVTKGIPTVSSTETVMGGKVMKQDAIAL